MTFHQTGPFPGVVGEKRAANIEVFVQCAFADPMQWRGADAAILQLARRREARTAQGFHETCRECEIGTRN